MYFMGICLFTKQYISRDLQGHYRSKKRIDFQGNQGIILKDERFAGRLLRKAQEGNSAVTRKFDGDKLWKTDLHLFCDKEIIKEISKHYCLISYEVIKVLRK